ncbi:MAG: hypothetical protein K2O34_08340 [Acetatifactor sp.]|nr:hypothetical protein [Acetatifactor sp.]
MSIETYANTMICLYGGLFLLAIFMGGVMIWRGIRKKPLKLKWLIFYFCLTFYSVFASYGIFIPYIAYDDSADPNYGIFKNWTLHNFILNDIKMLIIWLFIGVLFYVVLTRIEYGKFIKKGLIVLLAVLAVLLAAVLILSFTGIS